MAGRREWVPAFNWGAAASVAAGETNGLLTWWGEDELYVPYAADSATFLRLRGHIVVEPGTGEGIIGWRVRMGLDPLDAGTVTTAGALDDAEVAEEHFLDERFWWNDSTDAPSSWSNPYHYTFGTASKRKMNSPEALVISMINTSGQVVRVTPFIRALFLFP